MKTSLFLTPHSAQPDANVIEVWYGNTFIATVAGADGPGVRIVSKYPMTTREEKEGGIPRMTEVRIAIES